MWNNYKLQTEQSRRPKEMFHFGLQQQGPCGIGAIELAELGSDNIEEYGVDWGFINNTACMQRFAERHGDIANTTAFSGDHEPEEMNEVVVVEDPRCPYTNAQVHQVDTQLVQEYGAYKKIRLNFRADHLEQGEWQGCRICKTFFLAATAMTGERGRPRTRQVA
ncbi:hypothetical protein BKA70DRAFT_1217763 [Coprinopsis sp. MPI-PUGE-AT-0042]|nr:hypothetical protein BKA70DRAFT_1217763 [Coprinopsis sp. MPI-PUGE-AT-0042]